MKPKGKKTGKATTATKKKNTKTKKSNVASKSVSEREQCNPECATTSEAKSEHDMEESDGKMSKAPKRLNTSEEEGQDEPPLKGTSKPVSPEKARSIGQISIRPAPAASTGAVQRAKRQASSSSQCPPEEQPPSHVTDLQELVKHLQLASDLRMLDECKLAKEHGASAIWIHTQTGKIQVTEPEAFKQFLKTTEAKTPKDTTTTESGASTSTSIELSVIKASAQSEEQTTPAELEASAAQPSAEASAGPRRLSEGSGDSDSSGASAELWMLPCGKYLGRPDLPIPISDFRNGLADIVTINHRALDLSKIIILPTSEPWDSELNLDKLHQHDDTLPTSESYLLSKKPPTRIIR